MLHKKFLLAKAEIEAENYKLAEKTLADIAKTQLSDSSQNLLDALWRKLPNGYNTSKEANVAFSAAKLSELDNQTIYPGTSIVSCCMNRNDNLAKALRTWVKLPVDEIIIVDWSSNTPVAETIKDIADDRIKVLRVNGEKKWVLTYGFNVGLRFAKYSKVLKFDADIEVSEDFLELNNFNQTQFVRGYWKSALDEGLDSQVYVNGSFGAYKKHLKEIGYYNELITTYGWDDSDIYERLASQCGLGTKYLNFRSVLHLEQEESTRTAHQDVSNSDFLGMVPATEFNNHRNKYIGRTTDYWNLSRLQNYRIEQNNANLWKLERITSSIQLPEYIVEQANMFAAIHYLWHRRPDIIQKSISHTDLAQFLLFEYSENINFEITQVLLGELNKKQELMCFDGSAPLRDFLKKGVETARLQEIPVYVLIESDTLIHKRIGDINGFVEVIALPPQLLKAVLFQRDANSLKDGIVERTKAVPPADVIATVDELFKAKVYVDAQHGLGNRLRAIGSAAAIAERTGRELVIVWEADHHCECEFADLFDYKGTVINKSFVSNAAKYMDLFNYMEIEAGAQKDKLIEVDQDKHLYLRAAYTFNSPLSDWEAENKFIKALAPSKQVMELIKPYNVDGYVAAHIRMEAGAGLDHNTYDSVENWTQEGHDELHFWREKSHYSAFIKRIDKLIEEDSGLKLFVATDLQETYDIFEKYYGDRLVYLKRDVFDRSKEQIIYALADVLLLSKCDKLLGSTWSSFSEAAMRLSNTYSEIEMSGRDF